MADVRWQLQVDASALAFLAGYQNALMLRASPRHGCCGGTVFLPVAEPGTPSVMTGWRSLTHGPLTVYVEEDLVILPGTLLCIGLDRFLGWQRLSVNGLEASM